MFMFMFMLMLMLMLMMLLWCVGVRVDRGLVDEDVNDFKSNTDTTEPPNTHTVTRSSLHAYIHIHIPLSCLEGGR